MTAVFNCQGPLNAPIFVGSGMVSRRMSQSVSDFPPSAASEAVLKSKEAGAVAAFDRVPFSCVSANFTFNTDSCVSLGWATKMCMPKLSLNFSSSKCIYILVSLFGIFYRLLTCTELELAL